MKTTARVLGILALALALLGSVAFALDPVPPPGKNLMEGVLRNQVDVVARFIREGENVNKPGMSDGQMPLHAAAQNQSTEIPLMLLRAGADINARDEHQQTPLHFAAWFGSLEVVQLLVGRGADLHARNLWAETPLHRAAKEGKTEVARFLLIKGADVNAVDQSGKTPRAMALEKGATETVALLEQSGASTISILSPPAPGISGSGVAPGSPDAAELIQMIIRCDFELAIKTVQDTPVLANGVDASNGWRPLHSVMECNGRIEDKLTLATFLIERGADVNAASLCGWTPLHQAATHSDNAPLVRLLLEKGADPTRLDNQGESALSLAKQRHIAAEMFDLLDARAGSAAVASESVSEPVSEPEATVASLPDEAGRKARAAELDRLDEQLFAELKSGKPEQVKALIEKGARINARNKAGMTVLLSACFHGNVDVVKLLLAQKAINPEEPNRESGMTPFMVAVVGKHPEIIKLLAAKKVNLHAKDKTGRTALMLAKEKGLRDMVKLLDKVGALE